MGFSWACFTAIFFLLLSMALKSFAELVILRHPPSHDGTTKQLTCISEDDESALIWNHNYQTNAPENEKNFAEELHFRPKKHTPKDILKYAMYWNSSEAIHFAGKKDWNVVHSADRPMAPVFDYRWEDFHEFSFDKSIEEQEYLPVRKINGSSGAVVFSVRGSGEVSIFLCKDNEQAKDSCPRIIIGSSNGSRSSIQTCVQEADDTLRLEKNSRDLANASHEAPVVDSYEWRTFRIEWNSEENLTRVFKNTEKKPFLKGHVDQGNPETHLFIKSESPSRVRFHFYDYLTTEEKDAEISTGSFYHNEKSFCVQMMVALCSNCEMSISLIDGSRESSGKYIEKNISGEDNFTDDGALIWRSIYLVATLPSSVSNVLEIKIHTVLNKDEGNGRWALGNFHRCKSNGGVRKSTVTIQRDTSNGLPFSPRFSCQKLTHNNSVVVDAQSTNTIKNNTKHFQQFIEKAISSCGTPCTEFGKKWSVCEPTGCACHRGFKGNDCVEECEPGFYGYDCNEECGSCYEGSCKKSSGHCSRGCKPNERLLPPFCKTGEDCFEVMPTRNSLVLNLRSGIEWCEAIAGRDYLSTLREKNSEVDLVPIASRTFPIVFKKLTPETEYEVTVFGIGKLLVWNGIARTLQANVVTVTDAPVIEPVQIANLNYLAWLILPLLAVGVIFFVWYRKWNRAPQQPRERRCLESIRVSLARRSRNNSTGIRSRKSSIPQLEAAGNCHGDSYTMSNVEL